VERTIKKTLIERTGAAPWPWAARRIATRAMRFVAIAAPLPALALLLVAILPPVDSGGRSDRLVASALADSDTARGNGNYGNGNNGNGNGNNGNAGGNVGGEPGETGDDNGDDGGGGNSTGNGGGKEPHRDGGARAETGGGERSGDPTGSDLADEEIEARLAGGAPAIATQPALAAFRATVLSADQEAAAIAAGWGDIAN
jgi:hypothetical protein